MGAVADVAAEPLIRGAGTPEHAWRDFFQRSPLRTLTTTDLLAGCGRVIVVAPHPDDEVLGLGAVLGALDALGIASGLVSVTRGEASHPGSSRWPVAELGSRRVAERDAALHRLGWTPDFVIEAGIPDGTVDAHEDRLTSLIASFARSSDVVFTTWHRDGHPDHEATARAVARGCRPQGSRLLEFPVWMWHWARPGDARVPWSCLAGVASTPSARDAKRSAIAAHVSQLVPDETTERPAILPPSTLQRFDRSFECVFV